MKGNDTPGNRSQPDFNSYAYGFDSTMDIIYEKYRILESVVALAKGETEQFNIPSLTTVQPPAVFEFVEFLKTDVGARVANKWLVDFEASLFGARIMAMRLLLHGVSFSCSDQIMLCHTIDIAINSLTKDLVLYERFYHTRP